MAVDLVIQHVLGNVVAFTIDLDTYFMQLQPVPRIFNNDLKPQFIPNIDSWFQAKTQQRHSHRGFQDMVTAFQGGLARSFSGDDMRVVAANAVLTAKLAMIEQLAQYRKHFWIELLDPAKLDSVWAPKVREKFEELRSQLGDDDFHNYLCRMLKFATQHRPGLVKVFERLIERLGRVPQEPRYPATIELDEKLVKAVLTNVTDKGTGFYRGVPEQLQRRLEMLNGPV